MSSIPELPEKFSTIMIDFTRDLNNTFPEYASLWWVYGKETSDAGWYDLYQYCLKVYPERFFDILYQNEDIFKANHEANTMFLPNVDFKKLFYCTGVTLSTQTSIWKYLQLILFTIIGSVKDKTEFGSSMNLFEGIDEKELQEKLTEAMSGLSEFFQGLDRTGLDEEDFPDTANKNPFEKMFHSFEEKFSGAEASGEQPLPNPDDLHSHLKGLFGGKLGGLAAEIMEELTDDIKETLGLDPNDFDSQSDPKDVLKHIMCHPEKFMKIIQKIQSKIQQKMKSGDLSQEDIMQEASEMLRKLKQMSGNSKEMNDMFQNLAKTMGSNTKNMKVDSNKLDRMVKFQSTKDRIRAKLEQKKQTKTFMLEPTSQPNTLVYRPNDGEKQEKSVLTDEQIDKIVADIEGTPQTKTKAPKKKKKN